MSKSQMRLRPGFLLGLFIVFVIVPGVGSFFLPSLGGPTATRNVMTRRELAALNSELRLRGHGWLETPLQVGLSQKLPAAFFSSTNKGVRIDAGRTNLNGELLDRWGTPYRIEFKTPTNYVLRSAGADKTLGSKDDIVFDSSKNRFVSP